jgi:CcmD family protein
MYPWKGLLAPVLALSAVAVAGTIVLPERLDRWAAIAMSAQPPQGQPPEAAPEGFVPVNELPRRESLPAARLLIAAYAFAWVMIFAYLWSVWRRIGATEKEIGELSRRLEESRRR